MRLAKLELLAYGPFRGLALDFSAPGMHVVLGRNEAGKSTTLRAITGLLYGIDARTTDAHVHKPTDLRIAGVLESASGSRVRVVRRKGTSNTLLDDREKVVDESVMKKLLGDVSKETFVHAFGLDHDTLEAGAQALLDGKGDLGESLFDASVGGGGDVQRLLAHLEAEADKIYKPRASTLPLNEALKAFADAQKTVREKQSLPEAFLEQERGLDEANKERDAALAAMKELQARRARLERARKRAPFERRRDRAIARRAELGAVAEQVARVEKLKEGLVVYERALEHRRTLLVEVERLGDQVAEAARRAGIESGASTETLRSDVRKDARVHTLLRERTALTERLESASLEIVRLERDVARLEALVPAAPKKTSTKKKATSDDEPLFARAGASTVQSLAVALERARTLGDIEVRIAREKTRVERARRDLEGRVTALGLFHVRGAAPLEPCAGSKGDRSLEGTLDELAALRLPALVTVQRLQKRAEENENLIARLDERAAELDRDAASLEKQTAGQTGAFAPPDAAELRAARAARDEAWRAVREATGEATRRPAELAMEGLLRDADALADRMIREADRVTTLARLRSETETIVRQTAKVATEKAAALATQVSLRAELEQLFAEAGITPFASGRAADGYAEMGQWLAGQKQIAESVGSLREAESLLLEEEAKATTAKADLLAVLGQPADDAKLQDLVVLATRRTEELESSRRDAAEATRSLIELRAKLDERTAVRTRDAAALAEVSTKLAELLVPLGIAGDASAEEVNRSLDALRELFAVVDKRADADARARGADADVRVFEADLSRAIAELAPDLLSMEARDAASLLFARGAEARANAQELAMVDEQLAREGEVVLEDADRLLVADADAAIQVEEELTERIEELEGDVQRAAERIGGIRKGLEEMRAESHAAEAAASAQGALTRVRENVERWCRVRLAGHLLQREIERYREENQGPLLQSSSSLFSRLTVGAYAGIKAGFDDKDKPCLQCVRADGTAVLVAGLSDGTRDQLYLSLRLASLLRRADMAEPMPLVLDDVLIQLDDQRASAALAVLADVSKRMQVLFFTHHARLVDLARAAVPASDLVIHELTSAPPPIGSTVSA